MKLDYKENSGKKTFLTKPKYIEYYEKLFIMYLNEEKQFVMPNHKKNREYYENPSLLHLRDEL